MSYFMGNGRVDTGNAVGAYIGKPAVIEVLEERDGFTLQMYNNPTTNKPRFKILWDGESISLLDDEKEARTMFLDFAPLPKKKPGRPKKNAVNN